MGVACFGFSTGGVMLYIFRFGNNVMVLMLLFPLTALLYYGRLAIQI